MIKTLFLFIVLMMLGSCSSDDKKKPDKETETNNLLDPQVVTRIEEMGTYLRSLKTFEVSADTTFDIVLENEQKTEFQAKFRYKIRRPDKLFAEIKSDSKHRQYFFDGNKFVIYSPKEKLYGELPFKGYVGDLVKKLNELGIEVPLSDLFVWGTKDAKTKNIISAMYLNEEKKGFATHDHYAIRQDKIDWQVWILKGNTPLPEKVLYEVNDDKARPEMSSTLKWKINPTMDESSFRFIAPKGSHKIKLHAARKPQEK